MDTTSKTLYLAGGCFWGVEELFRRIPGVTATCAGYANGTGWQDATYKRVCEGDTGFRETVRVEFDPTAVSPQRIMDAYFAVINPSVQNRQGNDVGTQYQTGIYWEADDSELGEEVRLVTDEQRAHTLASGRPFYVEVHELKNFYKAEEYHQEYLVKNPNGYCHISPREMHEVLESFA